ncbi:MAG: hypothetical protein GY730_09140 [bacterium]|nr:hypothetical protein [bacterium]
MLNAIDSVTARWKNRNNKSVENKNANVSQKVSQNLENKIEKYCKKKSALRVPLQNTIEKEISKLEIEDQKTVIAELRKYIQSLKNDQKHAKADSIEKILDLVEQNISNNKSFEEINNENVTDPYMKYISSREDEFLEYNIEQLQVFLGVNEEDLYYLETGLYRTIGSWVTIYLPNASLARKENFVRNNLTFNNDHPDQNIFNRKPFYEFIDNNDKQTWELLNTDPDNKFIIPNSSVDNNLTLDLNQNIKSIEAFWATVSNSASPFDLLKTTATLFKMPVKAFVDKSIDRMIDELPEDQKILNKTARKLINQGFRDESIELSKLFIEITFSKLSIAKNNDEIVNFLSYVELCAERPLLVKDAYQEYDNKAVRQDIAASITFTSKQYVNLVKTNAKEVKLEKQVKTRFSEAIWKSYNSRNREKYKLQLSFYDGQ